MNSIQPLICTLFLSIVLTTGCAAPPVPSTAGPVTVDCTAGESINAAIAAGHDPITIHGICDENVLIEVDGVSLFGDGPGAGITPSGGLAAIQMQGATNTELNELLLDGSNTSTATIHMRHSDAFIQDVTVTGGQAAGILVTINSSATLGRCTLTGNNTAMTVINNSFANVAAETRIENTAFIGIISSRSSSVNFGGGSVIDGVNSGEGVSVAASSHFLLREGAQIINVTGNGIVSRGSSVGIAGGTITGVSGDAIRLTLSSSLEARGANITGNGGNGIEMSESSGGVVSGSDLSGNAGGALNVAADSVLTDGGGNTF